MAGEGQFFYQFAAFNLRQIGETLDGMFVDGIVMVHVELHHRHDWFEFWDEFRQNAQFVHAPQGPSGIAMFEQEVKKNTPCSFVVAHRVIDKIEVGCDQPHCIGVDQQSGAQPLFKQAQQIEFVGEKIVSSPIASRLCTTLKPLGGRGLRVNIR